MGSDLANVGLILGLTSVIRPLDVHARVVWREAPITCALATRLRRPIHVAHPRGSAKTG